MTGDGRVDQGQDVTGDQFFQVVTDGVIELNQQLEPAIGRNFVFEISPDLLGRVVLAILIITGRAGCWHVCSFFIFILR